MEKDIENRNKKWIFDPIDQGDWKYDLKVREWANKTCLVISLGRFKPIPNF